MAISRVIQVKLSFIGDSSTTSLTYVVATSAAEVVDPSQLSGSGPGQLAPWLTTAPTPTGVSPSADVTKFQKIPFTVSGTTTITVTFAVAPAAGVLDSLVLGLVVP